MKIDFIVLYSLEEQLNKCIACINNLCVPDGVNVSISAASEAENVAEAYNALGEASDADIKVFCMENTFITDELFIEKIIDAFSKDESLGMIGVLGEERGTDERYGSWDVGRIAVCNDSAEYLTYDSPKNSGSGIKYVQNLSGLILACRLQFKWEALDDTKHGYFDIAMSRAIEAAGYKNGVLLDKNPICMVETWTSEYERHDVYAPDLYCRYLKPESEIWEPLVSVIMPVYNGADFVGESIESILNQTYRNIELVIIDDCSSDNSKEVISSFADADSRVVPIYSEKNQNVCISSNIAFDKSTGEVISLIGHDDLFVSHKIEQQINLMDAYSEIGVCFTKCDIINKESEVCSDKEGAVFYSIFEQNNRNRSEWIDAIYYGNNCLCAPSAMFRRKLISGEMYNPAYVQLQDLALWLEMLKYNTIYIVHDRLTQYRQFFGESTNLNSLDQPKENRLWHETGNLKYRYIMDMEEAVFSDLFGGKFINSKASTHEELLCERAFVLKSMNNCRYLELFMELMGNPKTREVLELQYGFTASEFYEENKKSLLYDYDPVHKIEELQSGLSQAIAMIEKLQKH